MQTMITSVSDEEASALTRDLLASLPRVQQCRQDTRLRALFERKQYVEMLSVLKKHMVLSKIPFRSCIAGETYWRDTLKQSTHCLMFVNSSSVPLFSSSEEVFRKANICVYMNKKFLEEAPFETVVYGMSHELAHIVLYSLMHKHRYNEAATDITAMILGFRRYVLNGQVFTLIDRSSKRGNAPQEQSFLEGLLQSIFESSRSVSDDFSTEITRGHAGYLTTEQLQICNNLIKNNREPQPH